MTNILSQLVRLLISHGLLMRASVREPHCLSLAPISSITSSLVARTGFHVSQTKGTGSWQGGREKRSVNKNMIHFLGEKTEPKMQIIKVLWGERVNIKRVNYEETEEIIPH